MLFVFSWTESHAVLPVMSLSEFHHGFVLEGNLNQLPAFRELNAEKAASENAIAATFPYLN